MSWPKHKKLPKAILTREKEVNPYQSLFKIEDLGLRSNKGGKMSRLSYLVWIESDRLPWFILYQVIIAQKT